MSAERFSVGENMCGIELLPASYPMPHEDISQTDSHEPAISR